MSKEETIGYWINVALERYDLTLTEAIEQMKEQEFDFDNWESWYKFAMDY
ncbi:MAG: hypothetical protein J7647_30945 [Cyanobacteria bacterium SBLK]|nr:hypothetical protein [Cyanobacteria bacterium SBLK]